MDPIALTPREAAELLRMSEGTLLRLARSSAIPGKRVGGRWKFSRSALEAFVNDSDEPQRPRRRLLQPVPRLRKRCGEAVTE